MRKTLQILATIILLISAPTMASEEKAKSETETIASRYGMYFRGLFVGNIYTAYHERGEQYLLYSRLKAGGLASLFFNIGAEVKTEGLKKGTKIAPLKYEFYYAKKDKEHSTHIWYKNGSPDKEDIFPPNNYKKRPKVEDADKKRTIDPVSAIVLGRELIRESIKGGNKGWKIPAYTGKQRFDIQVDYVGEENMNYNGYFQKLHKVMATRIPVSGFKESEIRRFKKGEAPVTLYLTQDEMLWPVIITADTGKGLATVSLDKFCDTLDECIGAKKPNIPKIPDAMLKRFQSNKK